MRKRQNDREKGRAWAATISIGDSTEIVDAMVLGYFEWMDWFADKPSRVFVNAAFEALLYREETGRG